MSLTRASRHRKASHDEVQGTLLDARAVAARKADPWAGRRDDSRPER